MTICLKKFDVYLANETGDVPDSIHGLHGSVSDRLSAAFTFGQNVVGVTFLAESFAFILVVTSLSIGKIQLAAMATEVRGMPGRA